MKALLVFCDVEGPVAIEVPAQVNGSELDDCLGHLLSPAHSRTLHSILDEILAGALDRATGRWAIPWQDIRHNAYEGDCGVGSRQRRTASCAWPRRDRVW